MRLGYVQISQKKQSGRSDSEQLTKSGCEYVYIDRYQDKKEVWQKRPELLNLLRESQPGDTVVMTTLDHLSPHYQVWLAFLIHLQSYELELEILAIPNNQRADWEYMFKWLKDQAEASVPKIRVKKFTKNQTGEQSHYRFFSRDPFFRQMYRNILQQVIAKRSLREITSETKVPLGTVVRIKKEYEKFKQTLLLIGTFFLTVISLRMVQQYSNNIFLQVLICGIMTLLIVYFAYSDSRSE